MSSSPSDRRCADRPAGAYGLTVTGLAVPGQALGLVPVPVGREWPEVHLTWRLGTPNRPPGHVLDDERAVVLLIEGEYAELDRRLGTTVIRTRRAISNEDLLHPYFASAAGIIAQWHGRLAFHAGAFILDGRAWGLLGGKEAGKTTLLSALHAGGYGVLADDMVVVDGRIAFAGPRTLDLRPATAARVGAGEPLVSVRAGERSRLRLSPVEPEVPFCGWIVLEEAERVEMATIPLFQRMPMLSSQLMMGIHRPEPLLDLLTLPMWVLRMPRRWEALPDAVEGLVTAVTAWSAAVSDDNLDDA